MDFPSENWVFNDWEDFDTASANVVGDFTLEVFAQLRNTGRILDNFRCVLGGSKHLEIDASLMDDTERVFQRMALQNPEEPGQGGHQEKYVFLRLGGDAHHAPLQRGFDLQRGGPGGEQRCSWECWRICPSPGPRL
jgi:hypothetical protein